MERARNYGGEGKTASAEIWNAAGALGGAEAMGSRGVLAVSVGWEGADVPHGAGKWGGPWDCSGDGADVSLPS